MMNMKEAQAAAWNSARDQLEANGGITPMFALHCHNDIVFLPATWGDEREKHAFVGLVRLYAVRWQPAVITLITEAWVSKGLKQVRPAEDPERQEVVMLMAFQPDGNQLVESAPIVRDEGGTQLGDIESMPGVSTNTFMDMFGATLNADKAMILQAMPEGVFNDFVARIGFTMEHEQRMNLGDKWAH